MNQKRKGIDIYKIALIGILSAIAYILMFLEFSIPLVPSFIKMDISDLPALMGSLAGGPIVGVIIALIKNLLHMTVSTSGFVGELSNFMLNALFVLPAGILYKRHNTKKSAYLGALLGAVLMAVVSVVANYFIVYPVYYNFLPKDTIVAMYQAILPGVKNILQCLIVFNMPFTFVKGMISVVITVLIYKRIEPILRFRRK